MLAKQIIGCKDGHLFIVHESCQESSVITLEKMLSSTVYSEAFQKLGFLRRFLPTERPHGWNMERGYSMGCRHRMQSDI